MLSGHNAVSSYTVTSLGSKIFKLNPNPGSSPPPTSPSPSHTDTYVTFRQQLDGTIIAEGRRELGSDQHFVAHTVVFLRSEGPRQLLLEIV